MTKLKTRISLAVCALALCLTATMAQAANAHTKTVPFDTTFVGQSKLDRVDCTTHIGVCELYFSGVANYPGGDVRGADTIALHGHLVPTRGFVYISHTKFAGSIRGCGTGTARNVGHGTIDQLAPFGALSPTINPLKAGLGLREDYHVVPGSGTGDFAGGSGRGHVTAVTHLDNTSEGRAVGRVTCKAR